MNSIRDRCRSRKSTRDREPVVSRFAATTGYHTSRLQRLSRRCRGNEAIGTVMARIRLSRRYQVTIPREMRDGLHPGQSVDVTRKSNIIILVPERPISAYRGILKGVPTTDVRDKTERRF
ncbi:MAG TPA: AbrB/MazE/SpoVT family DNA-binding domain-containing protein [Thermoanaerobaculia bacterium]|nr:AbrB/MazE/SpoVT family DNA-binding domain-containing protein [Thermoanaerobaculia bacterium]